MDTLRKNLEPISILQTKLHRPSLDKEIVPRSLLIARLEEFGKRPLVLISASAGYGKTTLISNWLNEIDCPSAWLSLDEHDSSLPTFLHYLLAAVWTVFPDWDPNTRSMLTADSTPPVLTLARSLVNDLEKLETPFVLVLDDLHFIQEMAVFELLGELLRHPSRFMRLVIATRFDPPLDLNNMRAKQQVLEIRERDLIFTLAETSAFVNDVMGLSVDRSEANRLREVTDGWVTALRLAALSLRYHEDVDTLLSNLKGNNRYVQDYLMTEVLSHQPPAIQDWLLKTSILDRFCAPLCESVCGVNADHDQVNLSGREFIQRLRSVNLFLIPLDGRGEWFRFHNLLQQLLQHLLAERYNRGEIADLHVKASDWLSREGLADEALEHALAAGDDTPVLQLVAHHRREMINLARWRQLDRWVGLFSGSAFEDHPAIIILNLWRRGHGREISPEIAVSLDQVEIQLVQTPMEPSVANQLQGEIDYLRSYYHSCMTNHQESQFYAQRALDKLPDGNFSLFGALHTFQTIGYFFGGAADRAREYIWDELARAPIHSRHYRVRLMIAPCYLYWLDADLSGLVQPAANLLIHAFVSGQDAIIAVCNFFAG